tara:strand:- start:1037 stop:1558 length:522 start_codon:yes stop_codon:yes gene_type:complete
MKTVKIIMTFLLILTVFFFGTGLVIKESSYTSQITIQKPLEETFLMFNDITKFTNWNPEYSSIDIIDLKPGITGSRYDIKVQHNNLTVVVKEKVLAYVKNEKVTLFFDRDGVIETDDYIFTSDGNNTFITLNASYQAKSYILGCVLPYFKSKFKKIDEVSLDNFKIFAEKTIF